MEKEVNNIVLWLRKKVKDANLNGLLVGVSGGLDSAVVAYLIQRAFPENSLGVILPLRSNPNDLIHAEQVIEKCQINGLTIDLTESHKLLYGTIENTLKQGNSFNEKMAQLADANLRARLRMSTLYTLATNYNYLVTGTDNRSEWHTGYFTKYGDGGVDIQPIIEYTKSETREMAKVLGVPREIIEKQPSADLWEGQTDEIEMGTTYGFIDAYLNGEEIPDKDRLVIENMHARSEHKRHIPDRFKR